MALILGLHAPCTRPSVREAFGAAMALVLGLYNLLDERLVWAHILLKLVGEHIEHL